jgi:hypothetical protein
MPLADLLPFTQHQQLRFYPLKPFFDAHGSSLPKWTQRVTDHSRADRPRCRPLHLPPTALLLLLLFDYLSALFLPLLMQFWCLGVLARPIGSERGPVEECLGHFHRSLRAEPGQLRRYLRPDVLQAGG